MGNNDQKSKLTKGAKGKQRNAKAPAAAKKRTVSLPLELSHPDHRVPGSISGDAELARKALEALPGLTDEQLTELRERIDNGYYKSPTVMAAITDQIARLFPKK